MQTDLEFAKDADLFMESVLQKLSNFDPDELDVDLAMGVLSLAFADRSKCIMNRQSAVRQIWLAQGASAWHFLKDETTGQWLDTKGRGELSQVLADVLTKKLGRSVKL